MQEVGRCLQELGVTQHQEKNRNTVRLFLGEIINQVRMHYEIDKEIHLVIPKASEAKINKILYLDGFKLKIDNI
jgi:hypothetical protein